MKKEKIILIVNGNLSVKKNFIDFLKKYDSILCVDGAANKIINLGIKPDYILGDLDSINKINIRKYSQNLIKLENQNYNDLHKTLLWAKEKNIKNIDIIGIDGKRIDHTIGNFNIILECISFINITVFTKYGNLYTINKEKTFNNCYKKNISLFNSKRENRITTYGLKYELNNSKLKNLYTATLNKAINQQITIKAKNKILIFISNRRTK